MKDDFVTQILEIRALTNSMIAIATRGTVKSESESLLLLYGLILDSAHRIQQSMDNIVERI